MLCFKQSPKNENLQQTTRRVNERKETENKTKGRAFESHFPRGLWGTRVIRLFKMGPATAKWMTSPHPPPPPPH